MTIQNDGNWCHVKETILMINVAVARIEHAMLEGDDSFNSLSQSFVEIVKSTNQIVADSKKLEDSPTKNQIETNCQDISQRVGDSIVAFQFYDKLSQRMGLVSQTLNSLNKLLDDADKKDVQDEWLMLQKTIRSKYTLDADQEMFDAVLKGSSIEDALKVAIKKTTEHEVEFF